MYLIFQLLNLHYLSIYQNLFTFKKWFKRFFVWEGWSGRSFVLSLDLYLFEVLCPATVNVIVFKTFFSACLLLVNKYLIESIKTGHKFNRVMVSPVIWYHFDNNEVVKIFSTLEQNQKTDVHDVDLTQNKNTGRTESRRQAVFFPPSSNHQRVFIC